MGNKSGVEEKERTFFFIKEKQKRDRIFHLPLILLVNLIQSKFVDQDFHSFDSPVARRF